MLSFSSPVGLVALLGLLVPLAIYLWNRRPGRTVVVGSLRWLEAGANQRLRSLKPEQLLLFLLRGALLALLALAVAGLRWQQPAPPVRGQVFISPELLASSALTAVRPTLDSLRRSGYETRALRAGFPVILPTAWARLDSGLTVLPAPPRQPENAWASMQQAADSFPGRPIHVFTSASLAQFRGRRPLLPAQVRWHLLPLPDSSQWLHSAYQPHLDSLRLIIGRSTEDKVTFRPVSLAVPADGQVRVPGLGSWQYQAGQDSAQLLSATDTVLVRQRPFRAWIRADAAFAEDARYLRAALRAAALGLAAPLQLTVSRQNPPTGQPLNALFWLSAAPLPASTSQQLSSGMQVWLFPANAGRIVDSRFTLGAEVPMISLSRLSTAKPAARPQVLWADAFGRPLLTTQPQGQGKQYQFYTRLHPAWSALGSTPELPELLLPLLQPASEVPARYDRRVLPPSQISRTDSGAAAPGFRPANLHFRDLRPWLVALAGLLFGLERLLARRPTTVSNPATTA
ncbi:BatA domain-containing protein [Hymenobacter sp. J193]|uniref:BatA domain-containing protein n=1 Tax=Hymenobacter sp. J193 TaxID=2898429 RepID=UPI0021513AF4|nr:BatA domain-containing protein [Hymenobacter sp. J193]MCR5887910.1 BatA domain-containing protein [Hymenobacter sp. J193]